MKARKSVIQKHTIEELSALGTRGSKKIVKGYNTKTTGHEMEALVNVTGIRNVELTFKDIIVELDAYDKVTKTATEIKSNFGSKVWAEVRALKTALEIYALQELLNCNKIKNYYIIGINNKLNKKFGLDYKEGTYSLADFKNKKIYSIKGEIKNQSDMDYLIEEATKSANALINKMKEVNK